MSAATGETLTCSVGASMRRVLRLARGVPAAASPRLNRSVKNETLVSLT